uniref:Uncharacterized protein n=1 Tax=Arcella intermedia TaxID=1963864 RepID=A0A6B2LBD8_9EUKA
MWHKFLMDLTDTSDAATFIISFSKNGDFSAEVTDYQYVLIQNMVDFFMSNGTAEIEIDYLNDVGTLLLPRRLGMWLAWRKKMNFIEGGWLIPDMQIPLNFYPKNSNIQLKIIETLGSVYGIKYFSRLKRNITRPDLYNEVSVLLPEDWLSQPEKLVKALQMLDISYLDVSHLIKLSAHHRTILSISYDWEFVIQVSLVFEDPNELWLNNFNQLHPDTGFLTKLQHTLVKEKYPVMVELKFCPEFNEAIFHYKVSNLNDFI